MVTAATNDEEPNDKTVVHINGVPYYGAGGYGGAGGSTGATGARGYGGAGGSTFGPNSGSMWQPDTNPYVLPTVNPYPNIVPGTVTTTPGVYLPPALPNKELEEAHQAIDELTAENEELSTQLERWRELAEWYREAYRELTR